MFHTTSWLIDMNWATFPSTHSGTSVSLLHSPCCSILPKYLLWLVQFHRRYLNWYWHSLMPSRAPLATSLTISGWFWHSSACFPASRLVFLQMLLGSMTSGLPTALQGKSKSTASARGKQDGKEEGMNLHHRRNNKKVPTFVVFFIPSILS